MKLSRQKALALVAGLFAAVSANAATTPDVDEMWRIIQQQQRQIEELQAQLNQTTDQAKATDEKVEVVGDMLEQSTYAAGSGDDDAPGRSVQLDCAA